MTRSRSGRLRHGLKLAGSRPPAAALGLSVLLALGGCSLAFDLSSLSEGTGNSSSSGSDAGTGDAQPAGDAAADAGPDGESGPTEDVLEAGADDQTVDGALDASLEGADEPSADGAVDGGTDARSDAEWPDARPEDASEDQATADGGAEPSDATDGAPACVTYELRPTAAFASTSRNGNVAANAFDENFATRWESIQSADVDGASVDPQWIYFDYGSEVYINEVEIDWESACGKDYALQLSSASPLPDGGGATQWTTMPGGTVTGNKLGAPPGQGNWSTAVDTKGLSGVGRTLRVYVTQRCSPLYGVSMWEMRAFGYYVGSCH